MPITPTYPGVYIQEVASDVRTIVPVDTATTAFIGRALRGPRDVPVTCFSFEDFERHFGGLWLDSKLGYAVRDFFLNGGSKAIVVRVYKPSSGGDDQPFPGQAVLSLPAPTPATTNDDTASTRPADADAQPSPPAAGAPPRAGRNGGVDLVAANAGTWGDQLVLRVTREDDDIRKQIARQYDVPVDSLFNLTIRDNRTGAEEYYSNVTLTEGPRRLDRVLTAESELLQMTTSLDGYTGAAPEPKELVNKKKPWWDPANKPYAVSSGGSNGEELTSNTLLGQRDVDEQPTADTDGEAMKRGLKALAKADIFNMLCIPPYSSKDDVDPSVLTEAAAYCHERRAILIVDPPKSWTDWSKAKDGYPIKDFSPSENAAVFFPRIRKRNPLRDNQVEEFVPCGAVAGVIARTDFRRGVWKAPAGLEATLNGVEGLSVQLNDAENGELNPLGINCLRVMPAAGPVVWGARTSVGDDRLANQWKYLPVRRMALWIEETLYRNTQWAVFEPNDEPLWSSIRLNIGNFMNGLFRQGAFQGKAPAEAYFVKCDSSTTTQTDIDRGIVNVIVGFAPLKPAEFVIISIKQITNQGAA